MAEAVVAAVAVEETISTGIQAGVGAYLVAKPTMPLKATFRQLTIPDDEKTRHALTLADHSLTVVKGKAYIFGGDLADGSLATNDIYAFDVADASKRTTYETYAAIADVAGGPVPCARTKHAACAFNVCVAVFGGLDASGQTIDDKGLWLYNTSKKAWEFLQPASGAHPPHRYSCRLFDHNNNLLLYGGHDATGTALNDAWHFDYVTKTWTQLSQCPVSTLSAAVTNGVLYAIAGSDDMSSDMHYLELPSHDRPEETKQHEWKKIAFPTNPLTPGPRPRLGAGLSHFTTGHGRNFLAYFFGARQVDGATSATDEKPPAADDNSPNQDPLYWSDMWTLQLASDLTKPAKIKDGIRNLLGIDSGQHSWAEAEVLAPVELDEAAAGGKVHPGPRGYFGWDHANESQVLIWGGINAKGEREGDGWIIDLE